MADVSSPTQVNVYKSIPQIMGESEAHYQARILAAQQVTGDHSAASIAAATRFQAMTNEAIDQRDATERAKAAAVRKVSSVASAVAASLAKAAAPLTNLLNQAQAKFKFTRAFRGRTGTPFANDRGVDPPTYIEIAQMPANPQSTADVATVKSLGMKYNDFFITDTQEMDAEKAEVSETFGAPHVFASGRYMRKVMITGMCRTGAVNPDLLTFGLTNPSMAGQLAGMSDQDKGRYIVPHTLGLRVLYDRALRASEQISRSLFTRLIVDGEVYCGWFTTLNIARTGAEEGFAHFTMSMLVFSRYHKDEDWAAKLLSTGSLPAKNAFDDAAASATLASMAGVMTLKLSGSKAEVQGTIDETTKTTAFKSPLSLTVDGVSQPVQTRTTFNNVPLQGFSLQFGNTSSSRNPLNGSTTGVGTFDLVPSVTDFGALLTSLQAANGGTPISGKTNVHFTVDMKPATGDVITTLAIDMVVNATQTPTASGVTTRIGASTDDLGASVTKPAAEIFTTSTVPLKVRFNLAASGIPLMLTPTQISGTKLVLVHPTTGAELTDDHGPLVEAKVGTLGAIEQADIDMASKSGAAKVSVAAALSSPLDASARYELAVTFDYSQMSSTLQTANPFASATDLVTSFRYRLKIPGYNDVTLDPVFITAHYTTSWITNLIANIDSVIAELTSNAVKTSRIIRVTFNLNPASASRNADAVKQAVQMIVRSSSYDASVPNLILAGRHAFASADLANAVVTEFTGAQCTVSVMDFDATNPVERSKVNNLQLVMNVPQGITVIPMYDAAR
ncbi:MAG: hypothetical protein WC869_00510 [Phycisphaerae bacterium]|jgi:hypothetical protein